MHLLSLAVGPKVSSVSRGRPFVTSIIGSCARTLPLSIATSRSSLRTSSTRLRGPQYRHPNFGAQPVDMLMDRGPACGIQTNRGFIEDQDLRLVQQGAGNLQPATVPAIEGAYPFTGALSQPPPVQNPCHAPGNIGGGISVDYCEIETIVDHPKLSRRQLRSVSSFQWKRRIKQS